MLRAIVSILNLIDEIQDAQTRADLYEKYMKIQDEIDQMKNSEDQKFLTRGKNEEKNKRSQTIKTN